MTSSALSQEKRWKYIASSMVAWLIDFVWFWFDFVGFLCVADPNILLLAEGDQKLKEYVEAEQISFRD